MGRKRFISSLLLAIYLLASCGAMLSVTLCHCSRSQHFKSKHSCCHAHHHASCNGEGIKLPNKCGCTHDHSTEIDLYNYDKQSAVVITPAVCNALPAMTQQSYTLLHSQTTNLICQRKIPLPQSHFIATKGLRAPPVVA